VLLGIVKSVTGRLSLAPDETQLLAKVRACEDPSLLRAIRMAIRDGDDPLGDSYCYLMSAAERRGQGQTFTPAAVVEGMVNWSRRQRRRVTRIVDPGAGTGRYTIAALKSFPTARAVAVEKDPMVALMLKANLVVTGLYRRVRVVIGDYRHLELAPVGGCTLFIGNPPYVRHHDIEPEWKDWYASTLKGIGHRGSKLAGLHLHFFLKTLQLSSKGDIGCFITAAEWLDVGYGSALRELLTNGLGGKDVFVIDPTVKVFGDAMVSASITTFSPGITRGGLRFAQIATERQIRTLARGTPIQMSVARDEPKWSFLVRGGRPARPEGFIELGDVFRVSRGQVTGLNKVWVQHNDTPPLPDRFLLPAITDATDIIEARNRIIDRPEGLRRVISLPDDLSGLRGAERQAVENFLEWARELGAHQTYIAEHRKPWWRVSYSDAPPAVMTYMGRRPPVFALNRAHAHLTNVAHGLYPRGPLPDRAISQLVGWLNGNVAIEDGRVYAGGLTKFEPSEAMRILIPEALAH